MSVFGPAEKVEEDTVERSSVLNHESVSSAADHGKFRCRDSIGELLTVASRRQKVLIAHDDQCWHGHVFEFICIRRIGIHDRIDLCSESVRRSPKREWSKPADCRQEPAERARADDPASGISTH
jgi:hypothetical protein